MNSIQLRHIKKEFFDGTHRVKSPEETESIIRPLMEDIGVTKVIDVTPLDRLGIPVYCAIRPRAARGAGRVHAGKGREPLYAEVSAMMEAIERFSAEYRGERLDYSSYEELGLTRALDPQELILPRQLEMGEKLHWTDAWDLLNEEEVYVPANAVYHPYDPLGMAAQLFRSDTNGLASGNVTEEAILHAIFEVVERDALSLAERHRDLGRRVVITHDCPARQLIDMFEEQGIHIHLWLLNGRTNLPTIAAAADDTLTKDPYMLVIGSGTHTNPEIAALRALTEVAQSRGSQLHLRDMGDETARNRIIEQAGYERLKRINRMWFKEADETDLKNIPNLSTDYIDDDIRVALNEISEHAERVCVCDLSKTSIPVVRVIIPGFEVSYMDNSRVPSRTENNYL